MPEPVKYECPGPDECVDDLCHGQDRGMCGKWSTRLFLGDTDEDDDLYDEWDDDEPAPNALDGFGPAYPGAMKDRP